VNIIGTALSSLPDPYLKSGLFDLILKPLKPLEKNCIDPPLRTPSDSLLGLNPIYTSLVRLMPPLLICSGLKPPPLNFVSRLK
jgi:hypothetical protein